MLYKINHVLIYCVPSVPKLLPVWGSRNVSGNQLFFLNESQFYPKLFT